MIKTEEVAVEKVLGVELRPQRIYTKNSLFESTVPPSLLLENLPSPIVSLEISADVYPLNKDLGLHEAVLTVHINAKHQDNLLWHVRYQQAGLYTIKGLEEEQAKKVLNGFCMDQLYAYASAEINHLITQGGFLPIYLNPLNFNQLYRNRKRVGTSEAHSGLAKQSEHLFSNSQSLDNPKTI